MHEMDVMHVQSRAVRGVDGTPSSIPEVNPGLLLLARLMEFQCSQM